MVQLLQRSNSKLIGLNQPIKQTKQTVTRIFELDIEPNNISNEYYKEIGTKLKIKNNISKLSHQK